MSHFARLETAFSACKKVGKAGFMCCFAQKFRTNPALKINN